MNANCCGLRYLQRELKGLLRPSVFAGGMKRLEAMYGLLCIGASLFFFLCPSYYIAAAFMLLCFYAHASTSGTELALPRNYKWPMSNPIRRWGGGGVPSCQLIINRVVLLNAEQATCACYHLPHIGGGRGACGSSITLGGCLQLGENVVDTSESDWYSTAANITFFFFWRSSEPRHKTRDN